MSGNGGGGFGVDARIGLCHERVGQRSGIQRRAEAQSPGASIKVAGAVGKGNSTIRECSVTRRRQLRPNEIVAGIGGEPNNLPLHSKYAAVMVWVLLGGKC